MNINLIAFLVFMFAGATTVNRFMEGSWITSADVSILNSLTVFRELNVFQLFTIPVINLDFITVGLPRLVKWDYVFFGGNASLFQFFLYSLSAALAIMLWGMILGLLYNYFQR